MLDKLYKLAINAQKLDSDKLLQQFLAPTQLQYDILQLNKDQLYYKGIAADGRSFGDYAPYTLEYKRKIAPKIGRDTRTDNITLKDTGAFYDSFKLENERDQIVISADTEKPNGDLMSFGKILGLTDESKNELVDWIKEPLQQAVIEALQQ